MSKQIAVLSGDGIGPEVMNSALTVLGAVSEKYSLNFTYKEGLIGGAAFDQSGSHFPQETLKICSESAAILFGSVGGPVKEAHLPKWNNCEANSILALRKAFNFNANFRPAKVYPQLQSICPLRPEIAASGVDLIVIRELIGDIYFGEHKLYTENGIRCALDVAEYNEKQIESVAKVAFEAATNRKKKVTSVDKANVLATSKLWREVVAEVAKNYPEIEFENMLVDNCAMQLITNPAQFDVILTANLFGDILSDASAVLPGSLGLMASASLNVDGFGMYEPAGGSAPDIANKGIANPIAQIMSAAMLLKYSFGERAAAESIEKAVSLVLDSGIRTQDIQEKGAKAASTAEITEAIVGHIL